MKILRAVAVAVALLAVPVALPVRSARADGTASAAVYNKFKGTIVASDKEITLPDDEAQLTATLKKANKSTIERDGSEAKWHIYFVAFLNKKPGVKQISVVFYDTSKGKRESITYKDINLEPDQTILIADIGVSDDDDNIKPGKTYEVVLAHIDGGKETVFAKTKLTFK